jgi:hypothetical protein
MRLIFTRALAILVLVAGSNAAAGAASDPPTQVAGVVVVGGPPPKVATTFPADGAAVPGGLLVMKIVFDQVMTADGWSYSPSAGGAFPNCLNQPRLLADQRTFVLLCTVSAHQSYAMDINSARAFASAHGRSAKPFHLSFSTADPGTFEMHDALLQAGLADVDNPIMTWRGDGAGVSHAPDSGPLPGPDGR